MNYSLQNWIEQIQKNQLDFAEFVLRFNEEELGLERQAILENMWASLEVMRHSIYVGMQGEISRSKMVGGVAQKISTSKQVSVVGSRMRSALMRAIAVGEANACMGKIVAAPTAGASGILPAVLFTLQEDFMLTDEQLVRGLVVAGGIGLVIAARASIAGAIGGCQAECGSGAAMAAGAAVYLLGGTAEQVGYAVAIALKNMMGLVCDPVAGLVEVPCVKRNAGATAQALVAAELALMDVHSVIPVDEVIDAMKQVGDDLPNSLKETSQGGIAITPTALELHKKIFG